jgi:hypothetical protein
MAVPSIGQDDLAAVEKIGFAHVTEKEKPEFESTTEAAERAMRLIETTIVSASEGCATRSGETFAFRLLHLATHA